MERGKVEKRENKDKINTQTWVLCDERYEDGLFTAIKNVYTQFFFKRILKRFIMIDIMLYKPHTVPTVSRLCIKATFHEIFSKINVPFSLFI